MEHLAFLVFQHCGMDIVAHKKSVHKDHSNCTSGHRRIIQDLSRSDQIAKSASHQPPDVTSTILLAFLKGIRKTGIITIHPTHQLSALYESRQHLPRYFIFGTSAAIHI